MAFRFWENRFFGFRFVESRFVGVGLWGLGFRVSGVTGEREGPKWPKLMMG